MPEGHAGFVLPMLRAGMRVLHAGCGSGALTRTFGTAAHPIHVLGVDAGPRVIADARRATERARISTVEFAVAAPDVLPVGDATFDVVFAHGLFEHPPEPEPVLREFSRVLRPGGLLALSTVDWSKARHTPKTANADAALRGRQLLRRRSGGDPYAGRHIAERVAGAGFTEVREQVRHHPDIGYVELAHRVEAELAAAMADNGHDPLLASAARSAWLWARDAGRGEFHQCWVEVLARRVAST